MDSASTRPAAISLFNRSLPLIVGRGPALAIGPAGFLRQRDRRLDADGVTGRGAELERFQPVAEQIDVVNGLRTLVAAVDHIGHERVAAVIAADRNVLRA